MVLFFEFKHSAEDRVAAGTYISARPKNERIESLIGPDHKVNYDPRFPNQNKTKYCYQMYVDWHRCTRKRGKDYEPCQYFKRHYENLCPIKWVEKWDDQVENGTFAGKI